MEKKKLLLSLINSVLPKDGIEAKGPELIFYCPFCNHYKRKLQVNVDTQQWHCWVCDAKGRSLFTLLKKLKVSNRVLDELSQIYETHRGTYASERHAQIGRLPKEFQSLIGRDEKISSIVYTHARAYLRKRQVNEEDIIRYNIGYCVDGEYGGRIVIPSYDSNANLNYFVGRSFYPGKLKYKNPPVSKDIVVFELYINWKMPIVLCEGVFDAIAIKRNAIPLLGKTVSNSLLNKIIVNKVPSVILALDTDALDTSVKISQKLMQYGISVSKVTLKDKDPSEVGYKNMLKALDCAINVDQYDLILQKLAVSSV